MAELSAEPLLWEEQSVSSGYTKKRYSANVGMYSYVVDLYDYGNGKPKWRARFGKYTLSEDLYQGGSKKKALAASEAHHLARTRRLAWERYMAENDPPSNGEAL